MLRPLVALVGPHQSTARLILMSFVRAKKMLRVFVKSSLRRPPVPRESRRLCSGASSQNASDQSKYSSSKEIGNPISMFTFVASPTYFLLAWANPAGGASQDDRTSNAWKWVYPVGFGTIIFGMHSSLSNLLSLSEFGFSISQ